MLTQPSLGGRRLSNDILAKLVVSVAVMIGFIFWLAIEKAYTTHCLKNCPINISVSRHQP